MPLNSADIKTDQSPIPQVYSRRGFLRYAQVGVGTLLIAAGGVTAPAWFRDEIVPPRFNLPAQVPEVPVDEVLRLTEDGISYLGTYLGSHDYTKPGTRQYEGWLNWWLGSYSNITYPFVSPDQIKATDFLKPRLRLKATTHITSHLTTKVLFSQDVPEKFQGPGLQTFLHEISAIVMPTGNVETLFISGHFDNFPRISRAEGEEKFKQGFTADPQGWKRKGSGRYAHIANRIDKPERKGEISIFLGNSFGDFGIVLIPNQP